jgi:hypothetical protein
MIPCLLLACCLRDTRQPAPPQSARLPPSVALVISSYTMSISLLPEAHHPHTLTHRPIRATKYHTPEHMLTPATSARLQHKSHRPGQPQPTMPVRRAAASPARGASCVGTVFCYHHGLLQRYERDETPFLEMHAPSKHAHISVSAASGSESGTLTPSPPKRSMHAPREGERCTGRTDTAAALALHGAAPTPLSLINGWK